MTVFTILMIQITEKYSNSIDTDSDGIVDYLDLDADNDGIYDVVEEETVHQILIMME